MGKTFDELKVGDAASFTAEITESMAADFEVLSGDRSHKEDLGYGFLLASLLSPFYGMFLPGGTSICVRQELDFVLPYFVPEHVQVAGRITLKFESTRMVEIKTEIRDRFDVVLLRGKGLVKLVV